MIPTLYHIPNYRYHGRRMYTNRPPCGAMRGHGVPQPRFAFESLLDMLAEEIGMDPIDIRMVNAMDPNTRTVNDLDVLSCEFKATLKTVRERSGWDAKHGKPPFGRGVKWKKILRDERGSIYTCVPSLWGQRWGLIHGSPWCTPGAVELNKRQYSPTRRHSRRRSGSLVSPLGSCC